MENQQDEPFKKPFKKAFTVNGKTEERLVVVHMIEEKDERGKTTYEKDPYGVQKWYEYDENGRLIHEKDTEGLEKRYEYEVEKIDNPPGAHRLHEKSSDGEEKWTVYDAAGWCIYEKDSDGSETWYERDEKGEVLHMKKTHKLENDENGDSTHAEQPCDIEYWWEYDEAGHLTRLYTSDGTYDERHKYDERGNKIYMKGGDGVENWYEYDEHGNLIHEKNSSGKETWHEYDEKGNLTHKKFSNGEKTWEIWYENDENGNLIHMKSSTGSDEEWYEYDEKGRERFFRLFRKGGHEGEYAELIDERDERGNTTYSKMVNTSRDDEFYDESWYAYDEAGHEIYNKNRTLTDDEAGNKVYKNWEDWTEYEFFKNGDVKRTFMYRAVDIQQYQKDDSN